MCVEPAAKRRPRDLTADETDAIFDQERCMTSGEQIRSKWLAKVIPFCRRRDDRPAVGYVASGEPAWAGNADEHLRGFGE